MSRRRGSSKPTPTPLNGETTKPTRNAKLYILQIQRVNHWNPYNTQKTTDNNVPEMDCLAEYLHYKQARHHTQKQTNKKRSVLKKDLAEIFPYPNASLGVCFQSLPVAEKKLGRKIVRGRQVCVFLCIRLCRYRYLPQDT